MYVKASLNKFLIPEFDFRTGEYLNLVYEKLNTHNVDDAIRATVGSWPGIQLVDWTAAESRIYDPDNPGRVNSFWLQILARESSCGWGQG